MSGKWRLTLAAIAFDALEYTHQLVASGVPREQAEVYAKAMTAMFLHNFDALVTKDYLDARSATSETRMEAVIDKRFAEVEATVDNRCFNIESKINQRLNQMNVHFARVNLLLGIVLVAAAIPAFQTMLVWTAP